MREILHSLRQPETGEGAAQWQGMCLPHHGALCSSSTTPKEATKKQENYKNYIKTIERVTKKKSLNDQTISVLLKKHLYIPCDPNKIPPVK